MPTYKSKSNKPEIIYYDQTFLPGVETVSERYINLIRYPFLVKISDEPYEAGRVVLGPITAAAISEMQDFYRSIVVQISDDGCNAGDVVTVNIIAGDTDNINDFVVISEMTFTLKNVATGVDVWSTPIVVVDNVELQPFKFYFIAVTALSVAGTVTIKVKK